MVMKKIFMFAVVLLMAGTAFAQERLLQWDQLMDRSLYPKREARGFMFVTGSDKVMFMKDSSKMIKKKEKELFIIEMEIEKWEII